MRRLALLVFLALLLAPRLDAACIRYRWEFAGSGLGTPSSYFLCDLQSEFPTSGIQKEGDLAFAKDTDAVFKRTSTAWVNIGTSGVAGHVIEDEGAPLTQRANMNFAGAGVTCADAGGKTVCTIAGGGGGTPTGTGFRHVTGGVEDAAAKLVDTADVNNDQITPAKLDNGTAFSLFGKPTTGAGDRSDVTCSSDQVFGRVGSADIACAQVATAQVADDAVTFAKIQNVAADRLLGRGNGGGAGDTQEIALGANLSMTGTTLNSASTAPGGSDTHIQYNNGGVFGGEANLVYDDSGAGNGVTTVRKSPSGASALSNYLLIEGTLPSTLTTQTEGVLFNITPAGSSAQGIFAFETILQSGWNGDAGSAAIYGLNTAAGVSDWSDGFGAGSGNRGVFGQVGSVTVGANFGVVGQSAGGAHSVGVYGSSQATNDNAANIGVAGTAVGAGTNQVRVAGYFGLVAAVPTFVDAAIIADNGAVAAPIAIWRDSGTEVGRIGDGGDVTFVTGTQDYSIVTAFIVKRGGSAPASGACDAAAETGSLYVQTGDPASVNLSVFRCTQTGAASFAWHPISHLAATTAPATCTTGATFFDSDAAAGLNWFGCTSANTWTLLGDGGAGGGITELTGNVTAGPGSGSQVATIAVNAVTDARLRDSAATSVIGRGASSIGDPGDIVAGAVGQVLRQGAGPVLAFGAVDLADTDAVTGVLPVGNWTVLTTEGDIVFRNGSTTTRLPRGANGECLVATATTIQWGACSAGGGLSHPQVMTRVSLGY